ncbi:hypothetical protein G9A89_016456 [Geosiphon pyriformis]|nr:hypothetical protein G9A89_016456 [Geosiphon pyriformis]
MSSEKNTTISEVVYEEQPPNLNLKNQQDESVPNSEGTDVTFKETDTVLKEPKITPELEQTSKNEDKVTRSLKEINSMELTVSEENNTTFTEENESTNPLYAAFTDREKEAVSELKKKLPTILNNAQAPHNYSLWEVELDANSKDKRLEVILIKFLRARNLNIAQAEEMLTKMIKWRISNNIDQILDETFDQSIFSPKLGLIHGHDLHGHPVTYNSYGGLDNEKVFGDINRFMRWRIQLMERGIQELDFVNVDQMLQVHDYHGVSLASRDNFSKVASKTATQTLQDNYPEFLTKKFFINVPWWGGAIYQFISVFLPAKMKKKFIVTSAGNVKKILTQYIAEENLPTRYGGQSAVEGLELPK